MSPEQIRSQNLDPRADLYSFGCVDLRAAHGQAAIHRHQRRRAAQQASDRPDSDVQVYNDNVTPEFANLIKKMMAKKREDRPSTMWEFLKEFRRSCVFKILPKPPKPSDPKDHRKGFEFDLACRGIRKTRAVRMTEYDWLRRLTARS